MEFLTNTDIKIKLENNEWFPVRSYQHEAFLNFKNGNRFREVPIQYNNNDIKFRIERVNNEYYGGIFLIKETGIMYPIADWSDVKIFLINNSGLSTNWYNASDYQVWAYFDFIYNNDLERIYASVGSTILDTILPIVILPEYLNLESNVIFIMGRNDNNSIYYQKYNDSIKIRICDNTYARNGYLGFFRRITDYSYPINIIESTDNKIEMPPNIEISTTMDENIMCIVCNYNKQNIQFRPCNHTIMCSVCYLKYDKQYECIICRQKISLIDKFI